MNKAIDRIAPKLKGTADNEGTSELILAILPPEAAQARKTVKQFGGQRSSDLSLLFNT